MLAPVTAPTRRAAASAVPTVAAVICTRERPDELRRALRSLADQTDPADAILVVDNAPASGRTAAVVADFPGVAYVAEPIAGLDFARNRALRTARAEIVAFLDDDAVAHPGWLGAMRAAFRADARLGVCTGRVEPLMLETRGQRLFEANGGFSRGDAAFVLPRDRRRGIRGWPAPLVAHAISAGYGCSMAVRRDSALALGGFDEALDLGAALAGGGDLDMIWRMLDGGHHLRYEPAARAWHEHRRALDAAVAQIVEHNRALIAWLCKALVTSTARRRPQVLAFLLWRLLKPGVRLLRRGVGRDPLPAGVLLRVWAATWAGLVAYPAARREAARRRARGAA